MGIQPFDALRQSTIIYLGVSILVVFVALVSFVVLLRAARPSHLKSHAELVDDQTASLISAPESLEAASKDRETPSSGVYTRVLPYGLGAFLTFWVTLSLFPVRFSIFLQGSNALAVAFTD